MCALQLRDEILKYKVGAPARVGLVAPNDVMVPGGNTGLDPSQTSFFQVGRFCCCSKLVSAGLGDLICQCNAISRDLWRCVRPPCQCACAMHMLCWVGLSEQHWNHYAGTQHSHQD